MRLISLACLIVATLLLLMPRIQATEIDIAALDRELSKLCVNNGATNRTESERLEYLIRHGIDPEKAGCGDTLSWYILLDEYELAKQYLVKNGASQLSWEKRNRALTTANAFLWSWYPKKEEYFKFIDLFLEFKLRLDDVDIHETLIYAIRDENLTRVKQLLDAGADPNKPPPWCDVRGMLYVRLSGNLLSCENLPAVVFAATKSPEMVQLMLEYGAHLDKHGHRALLHAHRSGKQEVVKLLRQNGVKGELPSGPQPIRGK